MIRLSELNAGERFIHCAMLFMVGKSWDGKKLVCLGGAEFIEDVYVKRYD